MTSCVLSTEMVIINANNNFRILTKYILETSISLGVTGGGLVFQHADNRFYIVGILSLFTRGPAALYTNIKVYLDNFLLEKIARYNIL
jgi:hypothetical protein